MKCHTFCWNRSAFSPRFVVTFYQNLPEFRGIADDSYLQRSQVLLFCKTVSSQILITPKMFDVQILVIVLKTCDFRFEFHSAVAHPLKKHRITLRVLDCNATIYGCEGAGKGDRSINAERRESELVPPSRSLWTFYYENSVHAVPKCAVTLIWFRLPRYLRR